MHMIHGMEEEDVQITATAPSSGRRLVIAAALPMKTDEAPPLFSIVTSSTDT